MNDLTKFLFNRRVVVFDMDGVICNEGRGNVSSRELMPEVLDTFKNLHAQGWLIDIHTSRRSEEWFWETIGWLQQHKLAPYVRRVLFDKPYASVYIDDKGTQSIAMLKRMVELVEKEISNVFDE